MRFKKEFLGLDGFIWWVGVVENRQDPLGLGRCQVRVFGFHDKDLAAIPSEDLPWAQPVHSLNDQTFSTPKEGDYVFGFFLDGKFAQQPIMLGIIPGIPFQRFAPTAGFGDLRELSEIAESPKKPVDLTFSLDGTGVRVSEANISNTEVLESLRFPKESDLNRPTNSNLARAEKLETTFLEEKKNNIITVNAAGGKKWDEPPPAYGTDYPFNKVLETESGHLMEFDDTVGAERIQIAHRAGSFQEYYPSGSKVEKIVKNSYKLILSDDNVYVSGKVNITVMGDSSIKVVGDTTIECNNNLNAGVAKDVNLTVGGDLNVKATNIKMESTADTNIKSAAALKLEAASQVDVKSGGKAITTASGIDLDGPTVTKTLTADALNSNSLNTGTTNLRAKGKDTGQNSGSDHDLPVSGTASGSATPSTAAEATASGLTDAPTVETPNVVDPPFLENSPRVIVDEILDSQNKTLIADYIQNPNKYRNPAAAEDGVKENYAGTPDTGTAGQSLIVNTPAATDLCGFLNEVLKQAQQGYWSETGMGGAPSNPNILKIWATLGFGNKGIWGSDQTAWCMGFVNFCLKSTGYRFVQTARAYDARDRQRDYKSVQIIDPKQAQCGDIALWNYSHVNFVLENNNGRLSFIGGNQGGKSSKKNDNNPSKGDVTKNSPASLRNLLAIYRPVKK